LFSPWRCRRYVPPKRLLLQEPHGDTSQKTIFFIGYTFILLSSGMSCCAAW
jgi:hypothetical protein